MQAGIYYVQRGTSGFLCDSEWDGDSFTENPHYAIKRSEPWFNGGRLGGKSYECIKVHLWHETLPAHATPSLKTFQSSKGGGTTRFRYECPRCHRSTKSYALESSAVEAWGRLGPCVIGSWEECK